MASLTRSDLDFVLKQILLAEKHAAGGDLVSLTTDVFTPSGLRTVDGTFNNLVPGQWHFGASDNDFASAPAANLARCRRQPELREIFRRLIGDLRLGL